MYALMNIYWPKVPINSVGVSCEHSMWHTEEAPSFDSGS